MVIALRTSCLSQNELCLLLYVHCGRQLIRDHRSGRRNYYLPYQRLLCNLLSNKRPVRMASSRLRQLHLMLQRCAAQQSSDHTDNIQVTPKVSLIDQKVRVKVHGLPSKAKVTLHMMTEQEWRRKPAVFRSCGHFVTSDAGDLDLHRDPSLGGTYTGLDPMGPFWSLKPCPSGPQNIRMVVRNVDQPLLCTLSLCLGHWSLSDLVAKETTLTPLYSTLVSRSKITADVRRVPVKEGGVRGMLFLPPGEGPHPGVIDMFGTAGGLIEIRAALLASHGFAVLALPFFRYEDLPKTLEEVTFDYFEEAVSWFSGHKAVKEGGIGLVGVSKGAELALIMAWKCPQVKAAVSINGAPAYGGFDLLRKDGTVVCKGIYIKVDEMKQTECGLKARGHVSVSPDEILPVWERPAHLLVLVSDDDGQLDPDVMEEFYRQYPEEKRHLVDMVHYPGAGHLLEPPYTPLCRYCYNPFYAQDVFWGGNPVDHAAAQEDSWKRILNFLHKRLSE